jgi:Uncharacterized protein conserved in bacteria (DUF2334)
MAGLFGPVRQQHRALLRLEDVGPLADPLQLRQAADLLAAEGIPFSVAVYPVYVGPVNQHPRQRIPLQDRPPGRRRDQGTCSSRAGLSSCTATPTSSATGATRPTASAEDYEFYRVAGCGRPEGCGGRLVGPGDGVVRVASVADAGVTQQFPDDAGVAHRPPRSWRQRARGDPVLVVAPARAMDVDGGPRDKIIDKDLREG